MKLIKVFTVELAHAFNGHSVDKFAVGARIKTTRGWCGDKQAHVGVVTGTTIGTPGTYEVADFLQAEGFTDHEVYTVTFDDGKTTVAWPEEIEAA